jgi:hypothetical protein
MTSPKDRGRVLEGLFGEGGWRPWWRFTSLMALSLVVAVMGISLDSATLVIGAMLIAPLPCPVIAFSVSLTMGCPRGMAATGAFVISASIGSIALAWLLADIQPGRPRVGCRSTLRCSGQSSANSVLMLLLMHSCRCKAPSIGGQPTRQE